MKFTIYKVQNGYLLNIHLGNKQQSYVYKLEERYKMFAQIDKLCEGPEDTQIGIDPEKKQ